MRRLDGMPTGCRRIADVDWADVLSTAALHRTHFAARASVSARDAAEATAALRALSEGRSHAAVSVGEARERGRQLVFVFPGQGAVSGLDGSSAAGGIAGVCRDALRTCEAALRRLQDGRFTAVLSRGEGSERAAAGACGRIQPALFAMKVALSAVGEVSGWSQRPCCWGTAIGEIAAAVVAGILSLEEACRVVAAAQPVDAGAERQRRRWR